MRSHVTAAAGPAQRYGITSAQASQRRFAIAALAPHLKLPEGAL